MTRTGIWRDAWVSQRSSQTRSAFQGALLLLVIIVLAGVTLVATPALIKPFPSRATWYESAASFPRLALVLVVLAAGIEFYMRRRGQRAGQTSSGSDELDSSLAKPAVALSVLVLFIVYALAVPSLGFFVSTFAFLSACGWLIKLPLRQVVILSLPLSIALWIVFVKILKVAFGHGWLV